VGLKVLDQAIDTTTPTGRLMFNVLGAIAQFERELIRERMLVGIAKAKAEGKYKGRAPTARIKADKVKQLRAPQRSRANSQSAAPRCSGY
jgi:DNA invertase Pin-like site-specific DNA recombinase